MDIRKTVAISLGGIALACAAGVLLLGAIKAAAVVGGVGVIAAVAGGAIWVSSVVKTASEHAANKEDMQNRRARRNSGV